MLCARSWLCRLTVNTITSARCYTQTAIPVNIKCMCMHCNASKSGICLTYSHANQTQHVNMVLKLARLTSATVQWQSHIQLRTSFPELTRFHSLLRNLSGTPEFPQQADYDWQRCRKEEGQVDGHFVLRRKAELRQDAVVKECCLSCLHRRGVVVTACIVATVATAYQTCITTRNA
jgi:hypothetical protein